MDEWFLQFISISKANLPFYFRYKLVDFPMKELEMKKINEQNLFFHWVSVAGLCFSSPRFNDFMETIHGWFCPFFFLL